MKRNIIIILFIIATISFVTFSLIEPKADEFAKKDIDKWDDSFKDAVKQGEKVFHSALGSNHVSCDMCHPNGANTHPETYPKFQKQIGRVVTLREMINWCIQNPLEGQPIKMDDPKMILLETYITWERRGIQLAPGKH